MAPKRPVKEAKILSSVLVDETYDLEDGSKLRIYVDIGDILSNINDYKDALRDARSIPYDLENPSPSDPVIRWLVEAYEGNISDEEVLRRMRSHYEKKLEEVHHNATLLALVAHEDNVFVNEPAPYPASDKKSLPGIRAIPEPPINLNEPVERRLKQALDILMRNPVVMGEVRSIISALVVRLNKIAAGFEVDPQGFRPTQADGAVHEETRSGDVQPEAQP